MLIKINTTEGEILYIKKSNYQNNCNYVLLQGIYYKVQTYILDFIYIQIWLYVHRLKFYLQNEKFLQTPTYKTK